MKIRSMLLFGAALMLCRGATLAYAVEPDSAGNGFRLPLLSIGALTSTFGEYRSAHFHGGIDLSTDGKIGMPVIAIRSGYAYRVRVSGGGYGKALDLLLDNGMLATYAHLDRFSGKIETFVRSKQLERGNYEIDVFPEPFQIRVESGETIGYSGNTGFSFGPHLHFELRRGDVALNPLLNAFPWEEHVAPTFRFVKLTPVNSNSEIDGNNTPSVLSLKRSRERDTYKTSVIPEMAGAFLVSVSVFDRTEKASNRLSVYRLELFLDDSLLFESKFDEIESSRSHEVELAYDYGLAKKGEVYTHNLCRFGGSKLRLLQNLQPGAGVVDTDLLGLSGTHTLRVEATDVRGNTSIASVEFVANRRPLVDSVALLKRESSLLVEAEVENPGNDVSGVWMDYLLGSLSGKFARVMLRRDEQAGLPETKVQYSLELRLPSALAKKDASELEGIFRIRAKDSEGAVSKPFTAALLGGNVLKDASVRLDIASERGHAEITAKVSPYFVRPKIGIANGDTLWFQVSEEENGTYTANYEFQPILPDAATATCVAEIGSSITLTASKPLGVHTARKGWEGSVWSQDGKAGFVFGPETFYEDVYVGIEKKDREPLPQGLSLASDVFSLTPYDVVFDKAGIVVIRCDGDAPIADRIGVYRRDSGGNWSYVGAIVDSVNGTVGANVRTFSVFALIKDDVPPSVSLIHPRRGSTSRSATPPVYAIVRDVGSGLGWQGMSVSIDGKRVLSEWDPRVSRLSVVYDEPLVEGEHTVVFEVEDKAGNSSLGETHFRIAR